MIRGIHGLLYSSAPEATRAFIRDRLKLPCTDTGEGWLIFNLPEADVGIHPANGNGAPAPGTHDISFYCDDIKRTVAELRSQGVLFDDDVSDVGFGYATTFTMPGDVRVLLYEPKVRKGASRPPPASSKGRSQGRPYRSSVRH